MEEQLISFETAKLAKEKGFNIICPKVWYGILNPTIGNDSEFFREHEDYCSAPTQSLLQKWIRETHNLDIIPTSNLIGYGYIIYQRYPPKNFTNKNLYQTYEEALEQGLQEALQLIK